MNRKIWFFLVPVGAILGASFLLNTNPPTNRAQTANDAPRELQPRVYRASLNVVRDAAREAILEQKTFGRDWELIYTGRADENAALRRLDVEVPVLFFTDDLVVTLETVKNGTRVNVASQSRVGKGDFRMNRRHVTQFLAALDAQMQNRSPTRSGE